MLPQYVAPTLCVMPRVRDVSNLLLQKVMALQAWQEPILRRVARHLMKGAHLSYWCRRSLRIRMAGQEDDPLNHRLLRGEMFENIARHLARSRHGSVMLPTAQ